MYNFNENHDVVKLGKTNLVVILQLNLIYLHTKKISHMVKMNSIIVQFIQVFCNVLIFVIW